jgi:hypothetical protein
MPNPSQPPRKPARVRSLIGRRFGRLKVQAYGGAAKWGKTMWCCQCDCGALCRVPGRNLLAQDKHRQVSCGCARADPQVRWAARMKLPAAVRQAICRKMRNAVRERKPAFSLSAEAAAEILGCSVERVEIMAEDGLLGSRRKKGALYVSSGDVSAVLAQQEREQRRCAIREAKDIAAIARASARRLRS